MFDGKGIIELLGDHQDFSFTEPDKNWMVMMPQGSIRFVTFDVGDSKKGPIVLFGYLNTTTDEEIDWQRVDPYHFHGSDHLRVTAAGKYLVTDGKLTKRLSAGDFQFQDSGTLYREIPEDNTCVWLMHVVGDRRGVRATIPSDFDRKNLIYSGNPNDKPLGADENYVDGIPRRGIPAIVSTLGSTDKDGYLDGSFDALGSRKVTGSHHVVVSGFFGDRESGPVALLVKSDSESIVSPPSTCGTERVLFIVRGSCRIGEKEYKAGEVRVQSSDSTLPMIQSGADGLDMTILIADRRHPVAVKSKDDNAIHWEWDTESAFANS